MGSLPKGKVALKYVEYESLYGQLSLIYFQLGSVSFEDG